MCRTNLERLDITIWGAHELSNCHDFGGENDCYTTVKLGDKEVYRTPVIHDTLNPHWENAICTMLLPEGSSIVQIAFSQ